MSFRLILAREVARELRSKEALLAGLVMVALFLLLDLFAFRDLVGQSRAAAAALWAPLLFGAAALCGRSLAADADRGTLDLLRLAPIPTLWHGLARTLTNSIVLTALVLVTLVALVALFAVPWSLPLVVVLGLAVVGIAVVATLAGGLAAHARSREVLLPVLMVPVLAPLVQAGVSGSIDALAGAELAGLQLPILLMAGYDVAALGVAWILWPIVLEGD